MAAKNKQNYDVSTVLGANDPDAMTPEEEAAAAAESQGQDVPEPPEQPTEPTPEPQPEGAAAPEPDKPAKPKPPKGSAQERIQELVAQRDLEREKNAGLAEELTKQREAWARLDSRRQTIEDLQKQAQQQAEAQRQAAQRPDPEVDPVGAKLWDIEKQNAELRQTVTQFQQNFQGTVQQQQQAQAMAMLDNWVNQDVMRFQSAHPDYAQARDYLMGVRMNHYRMMGYNDQGAAQMWDAERRAYEVQAAQNGRSIAEIAYNMAQSVGYKGSQPANGNAAPQPSANGGTVPNGKERVQQIQQAQRMQGLGGKEPAGESEDYAALNTMTAQQFSEYLDKIGDEGLLELPKTNPKLHQAILAKFEQLG